MFHSVQTYEWVFFYLRLHVAGTLIILDSSPHQALDLLPNVVGPRAHESLEWLHMMRQASTGFLAKDRCGEVAYKKLLEMCSDFGVKDPIPFHEFSRYYVWFGKTDLAVVQLGLCPPKRSNVQRGSYEHCGTSF